MNTILIELRKEKRTGISSLFLAVGILGAIYAFVNFMVRKETLLKLPLPPMDVLLTQLYGMIVVLNLFGIIVGACMIYYVEFQGNAIKKMYTLPINIPKMYFSKFIILTLMLLAAVILQNSALARIGITDLPAGTFELRTLLVFAGYSFITSMPVLAFMMMAASCFENMWVSLGIGVTGFLSSMALATVKNQVVIIHPFVVMLRPAVAMSALPDRTLAATAIVETILFLAAGLYMARKISYE